MNRGKYIIKNFIFLFVSQFASKALGFFLIPLYTSYLSAGEYGIYDILNSLLSLIFPVLLLDIWEGTTRFTLENKDNANKILNINIVQIIYACTIVFVLLVINSCFSINKILKDYSVLWFLLFFATVTNVSLISYARGLEKLSDIALASFVNSIVTMLLNIILIAKFKMGIVGLLISSIVGILVQDIILVFILDCPGTIKSFEIDKQLRRQMLKYSTPFVFNTISWWVVGLSDRFILTALCSLTDNGIYAISAKIPSILNIVVSIFSQSWSIAVIKEYNKDDFKKFYYRIYDIMCFLMMCLCSMLIIGAKIIAKLLFKNEYYIGWMHVPFLTFSVVFIALSDYAGVLFHAAKKTKIFAMTSTIGAVINIALNFILIKYIGAIGASIATLFSYFAIWISRAYMLQRELDFSINKRLISVSALVILSQIFILYTLKYSISIIANIMLLIIYIVLNNKVFIMLCEYLHKYFEKCIRRITS